MSCLSVIHIPKTKALRAVILFAVARPSFEDQTALQESPTAECRGSRAFDLVVGRSENGAGLDFQNRELTMSAR
jgi:hypothetical protein